MRRSALIALALCAPCASLALAAGGGGLVQTGPKLVGPGAPGHEFGQSVALSGDGATALIGATDDSNDNGAVWIFIRSGSSWKQQGPKLVGSTNSDFGNHVALSANGKTALITESSGTGHVWVYTRSGTGWIRQAKLVGQGEQPDSAFGQSIALSGDGDVALVGDPLDHHDDGKVWTFTRRGSTWTQDPALTGTRESYFGTAAALSSDGRRALIGSPGARSFTGQAQIYARTSSTWVRKATLIGKGGTLGGAVGTTVALSADGATAVVAGQDIFNPARAWVFSRSGSSWKQTPLAKTSVSTFGSSLALSADGRAVLISADKAKSGAGVVFVYRRAGAKWTPMRPPLTGGGETGAGAFGGSVSLSANGRTALVGGTEDSHQDGAAWVFAAAK